MVTTQRLIELADKQSVSSAIEFAEKIYGKYPDRPSKPTLQKNANSAEAKNYAILLEQYESAMESYSQEMALYKKNSQEIQSVIVDFIKEYAGINIVPVQYRDKVYLKAYSDGHAYGFYEVFLKLNDLIEIFE